MAVPTPQSNPPIQPPKQYGFWHHHMMAVIIIGVLLLAAIIAGVYYYQVSNSIPPAQQVVHHAQTDPTANWQTYTNSQYSFTFKYPTSLIVDSNEAGDGEIDLTKPEAKQIFDQEQSKAAQNLGTDGPPPPYDFAITVTTSNPSQNDIKVDDTKAFTNPNSIHFTYYDLIGAFNGGLYYTTQYSGKNYNFEINNGDESQLLQILSTFKFTDGIPTSVKTPTPDEIVPYPGTSNTSYVKDEVDIDLKLNTPNPDQIIKGIASQLNASVIGSIPEINSYQLHFNTPKTFDQIGSIISDLKNSQYVNSADYDLVTNIGPCPC